MCIHLNSITITIQLDPHPEYPESLSDSHPMPTTSILLGLRCLRSCQGCEMRRTMNHIILYNFNIQVITHPLKLSQHLMWWDQYQRIKMIKIGIFWRSETQLQCVHQALGVYQVAAILKDKICQTQTFSIQNAKYLLLSCFKGWLTKGLMSLFCLPGFGHLLAPPWYFQASSRLTSLQKSR